MGKTSAASCRCAHPLTIPSVNVTRNNQSLQLFSSPPGSDPAIIGAAAAAAEVAAAAAAAAVPAVVEVVDDQHQEQCRVFLKITRTREAQGVISAPEILKVVLVQMVQTGFCSERRLLMRTGLELSCAPVRINLNFDFYVYALQPIFLFLSFPPFSGPVIP